ncbi:hypothetical protein P171DRAFT_437069 [Karstenula rhodostoma CBS 690.94]|uniref:Uncharacterized protein n=1 Tax=Karstenula rhodostoma CBS 690.94 TaxID=1392251 RepID=A0A9P4P6Z2_9PLEO|nr:hypothetical protein P171DRAFT_437069 [Karstenula rhodostoma CBS 690.94]
MYWKSLIAVDYFLRTTFMTGDHRHSGRCLMDNNPNNLVQHRLSHYTAQVDCLGCDRRSKTYGGMVSVPTCSMNTPV